MDNLNQVIKICGICGNKRVSDDYHRLHILCKICFSRNSVRYHQAFRDNINARSNLYQENTKYVRKCHTQHNK